MWKFIFYPQWNYEVIEKKLSDLERTGYRLERIRFFWFFMFVKCKPKNANYIFTYNFLKEHPMLESEYELRSKYNANQIDGGNWLYTSIYRVTQTDYDLNSIKKFRCEYLKKIFIKKILFSVAFVLICLTGVLFSDKPIFAGIENIILCILGFFSILYVLWYLGGLLILIHRSKGTNISNNT